MWLVITILTRSFVFVWKLHLSCSPSWPAMVFFYLSLSSLSLSLGEEEGGVPSTLRVQASAYMCLCMSMEVSVQLCGIRVLSFCLYHQSGIELRLSDSK